MSEFLSSVNLQLSPDLINEGEQAILKELALQLYAQNIFTFGQARRLANLSVWELQKLLGERQIPRHYDIMNLLENVKTIKLGF